MKRHLLPLLVLALFTMNAPQANLLKITIAPSAPASLAIALAGLDLATLTAEVENDINSDLPDADASSYLKGMANASVYANKGLGTDYASGMDLFVVGLGVGVGLDVGKNSFSDLIGGDVDAEQFRGFGLAGGVIVGGNLGIMPFEKFLGLKMDRVNLYLHFFTLDENFDELTFDFKSIGAHLQYQIINEANIIPLKILRWDGVRVTLGYEYTKLSAVLTQTYTDEAYTGSYGGINYSAAPTGTFQIGADVATHSIPIEISTGLQWAYICTTYLGLGVDMNFGSAKAIANGSAGGTITIAGDSDSTITGALDLGQEGDPSSMTTRAFVGQQFNLSIAKIGVHLNKGIGNDLYGVNLSLKILW